QAEDRTVIQPLNPDRRFAISVTACGAIFSDYCPENAWQGVSRKRMRSTRSAYGLKTESHLPTDYFFQSDFKLAYQQPTPIVRKAPIAMHTNSSSKPTRKQIGVGGFTISERGKQLVMQALESNRLSAGPMMARFESEMAAAHDCKFGLMCNSGTSALHIALAALREVHGWRDGDEVLVPAVTFVASSNVVMYNNLKPVFVDVDPKTYTLDPAKIEARITPRTRAIMPVHIGGQPCDMEPIVDIAGRCNLRIVEDSCETMFVSDKGKMVGSFGDVGCFSTYVAHVITTGVGGLCTTNDPDLIVILKSLMNHGRDSIYIRIDDDKDKSGQDLF